MSLGCRTLRVLRVFGLGALFAVGPCLAMSVAAQPPLGTPAPQGSCPVLVDVDPLYREHRMYALHLESSETGRASGTIVVYAGDQRYEIPFESAVVGGWADDETVPTPIVVRFPAAIDLDAAYVSAFNAPLPTICGAPFLPWLPRHLKTRSFPRPLNYAERYMRSALDAEAHEAPPPNNDPRTCSMPDRRASVTAYASPEYPAAAAQLRISATAYVQVILNGDGSVYNAAVVQSTSRGDLDDAALVAAKSSRFLGATFRCKPAAGAFVLGEIFGP